MFALEMAYEITIYPAVPDDKDELHAWLLGSLDNNSLAYETAFVGDTIELVIYDENDADVDIIDQLCPIEKWIKEKEFLSTWRRF